VVPEGRQGWPLLTPWGPTELHLFALRGRGALLYTHPQNIMESPSVSIPPLQIMDTVCTPQVQAPCTCIPRPWGTACLGAPSQGHRMEAQAQVPTLPAFL